MIDKKILRDRLINDFDYPIKAVDMVVEKISAMSPDVYAAFEEWFNTGKIVDLEIEGYNFAMLKAKEAKMNTIAIYLSFDWLAKEPVKAKAALERPYNPLRK